jgi:hypothetical protein
MLERVKVNKTGMHESENTKQKNTFRVRTCAVWASSKAYAFSVRFAQAVEPFRELTGSSLPAYRLFTWF